MARTYKLRYHVLDVFIPGATVVDEECVDGQVCSDCEIPVTPTPPEEQYEYLCDPITSEGDQDSADCVFDPDVVPTWYLEFLIDLYTPLCAAPAPPPITPISLGNTNICAILFCAQDAIDNGPPSGTFPLYSGPCGLTWGTIVSWWRTEGPGLVTQRCHDLPLTSTVAANGATKVRFKIVKLPPGSRVVNTRCIDVTLGEPCCSE